MALDRLKALFPNFVCIVSGYMTPSGLSPARTAGMLNDVGSPVAQSYDAFRRLEKEGFVVVTGFRTDMQNLLAASDCLIFPSTVSHFARPVIEAACMAKPVIASSFPELAEVVVDGKTGILVPPNDAEALANALASLLADDGRMKEMGEAAHQEAIRLFDVRTNIQQILGVYEEVLGERFQSN
jgi:glycosyltransferase involved in cell wall biosynthesis